MAGSLVPLTWPQELSVISFSEPVDVEDFGQFGIFHLFHGQPMIQIVTEVVAEERPHREGIVHDFLNKMRGT